MRSSQTAEALPTQAGPQTTHPVPRPLFLQLGKLRTASRSQITKPAGGGSCRSPLASCFLQRALSPAPPAPRYPSLISTAQTRWAASMQPGRMHWRRYVNYEALRKLTSRWRRKTPPGLTGRRPASPEPRFSGPAPTPAPQRRADPHARLSGLQRPASGRSRYSLEQIRDMAPSLHSEAPHTGLRDQLLGPRGTLPVPSLLPDAPLRAGSCPAERCLRMASRGTVASRAPQPPEFNGNCPFP